MNLPNYNYSTYTAVRYFSSLLNTLCDVNYWRHEIGSTTVAQRCDRSDCTAEQLLFVFTLNISHRYRKMFSTKGHILLSPD